MSEGLPRGGVASLNVRDALRRGETGYDEKREKLIWNARLACARAPDIIASPPDARAVAGWVRFAADRDMRIGLRSGGHNYEASALRDGGILLDLGRLDRIEIDTVSRTARVGPGVRGGRLIETLAAHGMAFPIGHCADVGIGGYLLSGGFGWNMGEWGPACASVVEVELVLASGEIVRADERRNAELFWAARGSGTEFFAVATQFRLQLHDLPPAAFAYDAVFDAASIPALAPWLTDAAGRASRAAEITALVGRMPEDGRPSVTLRAEATGSTAAEARARTAPLLERPPGVALLREPAEQTLDFTELTRLSAVPAGKRVAADHMWSEAPLGDLLVAVKDLAAAPGKMSTVNLFALGGSGEVRHRPDPARWALSLGGGTVVGIYGIWDDAADDARHCRWVNAVDDALRPMRVGRYIGEACIGAGPGRLAECFTSDALARIRKLRSEYDPAGLFSGSIDAGASAARA